MSTDAFSDGLLKSWYVYSDEDGDAVAVARHSVGKNGGWVGKSVAHRPTSMSSADWNETARLIAAAPDLLEALKHCLAWIDNWSPEFTEDEAWPEYRKAFNAAISKAEGAS